MNKLIAGLLFIVLSLTLLIGGVAYSAVSDLRAMVHQNFLVLMVDEAKANEIELGLGLISRDDARPFLLDLQGSADRLPLEGALSQGIEAGGKLLIGRGLPGIYIDGNIRGEASFERIIIVPISIIARMVNAIGGVDFKSPEPSEVKVARQLTGSEISFLLRSDGFSGTGNWRVSYVDSTTGERVTRDLEGDEFGDLVSKAPGMDRQSAWSGVKFLILSSAVQGVAERGTEDPALLGEEIGILVAEYKRGGIKIYPENTATRLAKILPAKFIGGRLASLLIGG